LATKAVRGGDHYVVTGSKIWATQGHRCNGMFEPVRTGDTGRKEGGMTFLLMDLQAPGVHVRPIISIDGTDEFNQNYCAAGLVRVSDRVGAEGDGWDVAKYLLEFERGGSFAGGALRALCSQLVAIAGQPGPDGRRALDDPLFMEAGR